MKNCSKKMCGHGVSVKQRSEDCSSHIVSDFLICGYPCATKENVTLQCPKRYGIWPTSA